MTVILGVVDQGRVYMGADSQATAGWQGRILRTPKVFRVGELLIGLSGELRLRQVIKYHLPVSPQADGQCDEEYLVTKFITPLRLALKDDGASTIDSAKESIPESEMLIGYRGRLYTVDCWFQLVSHVDDYSACGGGEHYGLAALEALRDLPPEPRILRALEITAKFSIGVAPPFVIESI